MMFFAFVLTLAALSSADSEIKQLLPEEQLAHEQQKPLIHEQPQHDNANVIPIYKHTYNPYSLKLYYEQPSGFRDFYSYWMQKNRNYPRPYYFNNMMSSPFRNSMYLRYLNALQRSANSDSLDGYYYQDTFGQNYDTQPLTEGHQYRKLNSDLDSKYYSPSSINQKYHLMNRYYGKNLDLENEWPVEGDVYDHVWDVENNGKYVAKNLAPLNTENLEWEEKPLFSYPANYERKISRNMYPISKTPLYQEYQPAKKYHGKILLAPIKTDQENVKLSVRIPLEKIENENVKMYLDRSLNEGKILNENNFYY